MKIAALYWPTSSVGGINTELRTFHAIASERGHTFHVLRSGLHKNLVATVFPERKLIRGGDTFVTIDGEASHHPDQLQNTIALLNTYDHVYLAYLCPHPTKDYGTEPLFLDLLQGLNLATPVVGRITDGYWNDYAAWGNATLDLCDSASFTHPSAAGFWTDRKNVRHGGMPFNPSPKTLPARSKTVLTCWTSQWKAIKGIHKLLPHIGNIPGAVELYSNGILYYQLRTTPDWINSVGKDHFKGFDGVGHAEFFGYIPLDDVPSVYSRSWFMLDLMGIGKPKNETYIKGAHNNTTIEAAWYGCCPILHARASSVVPKDIALFINHADEAPALIGSKEAQAFALDKGRQRRAKEWVSNNFLASKVFNHIVLGEQQ